MLAYFWIRSALQVLLIWNCLRNRRNWIWFAGPSEFSQILKRSLVFKNTKTLDLLSDRNFATFLFSFLLFTYYRPNLAKNYPKTFSQYLRLRQLISRDLKLFKTRFHLQFWTAHKLTAFQKRTRSLIPCKNLNYQKHALTIPSTFKELLESHSSLYTTLVRLQVQWVTSYVYCSI